MLQSGNKGGIEDLSFHANEPYLLALDENQTITIWELQQQKQYARIAIDDGVNDVVFLNDEKIAIAKKSGVVLWNFKQQKEVEFIKTDGVVKQLVFQNGQLYFLTNSIFLYDENEGAKEIFGFYSGSIQQFHVSENGKLLAFGSNNNVVVGDFLTGQILHQFKTHANDLHISSSENTLAVASGRASVQIYDLEMGRKTTEIANTRAWKSYNSIHLGNNKAATGDDNDVIQILDLKTGKTLENIKNKGGLIHTLTMHPENKLLATGGENGIIHVYDFESGNRLQTCRSVSSNIISITPSGDQHTYILGYDDGTVKSWDFKTHEVLTIDAPSSWLDRIMNTSFEAVEVHESSAVLKRIRPSQIHRETFKEKFFLISWDDNFNLLNTQKGQFENRRNGDLKKTKGGYSFNDIELDLPQSDRILSHHHDETNGFVMAGVDNGFLYFFDDKTGALKLKAFSIDEHGFFYITPDHYYFASKSSLDAVSARFDGKLLDFKQLDIRYNRPDKVLEVFPFYSKEYLSLLKKARKKRLEKLNIDPQQKFEPDQLPELSTNFNEFPLQTELPSLKLKVKASSPKSPLKALHIVINGVPQFGVNGIDIASLNAEHEVELLLTTGTNKIESYVETVDGYESIRQKVVVQYKQKYDPHLYVLSIGSGTFESADFNLKYAAKDASELSTLFGNNKTFNSTTTIQMTGKEVTRDLVFQQLEVLKKAKRNDVVIVFFAGHGLLDYKLDYYLSTFDMNFNAPEEKGISMAELETAMANLPCQNKILLLDACHSGELDKDEVISMSDVADQEDDDIQFRKGLKSVGLEGSQSVFELSKNIFADLRRNNGVITISSAGADEFALEGGKWKNGAFTYAILDGLSSGAADLNGDKKVTSNELSRYLFQKVPELTQGKQTPTSRVENLDKNIRIW